MRWTLHGERTIYESEWTQVVVADVELPDGSRIEHDVVRLRQQAAAALVRDSQHRLLLIWRHRFITDSWSWELPAGAIEEGESPEEAAAREALEETGWRVGGVESIGSFLPLPGRAEQTFHVCRAEPLERVGDPVDAHEVERVEWVPVSELGGLVTGGELRDGYTLAALAIASARGVL